MKKSDKKQHEVLPNLEQNLEYLRERLPIDESYDLLLREIQVGRKRAAMLFVDGFTKDMESLKVIQLLQRAAPEDVVPNTIDQLLSRVIPYYETSTVQTLDEAIDQLLAGPTVLLVEGARRAIIIDLRTYPTRSVEEPETEKVTRGSKEGFVETIVFNTALIRRRVRDPQLRFEALRVGKRSKTDVALGYIADIADPDMVASTKRKLEAIEADALPEGVKNIEEYLYGGWLNPLPKIRLTERPDVAAAHLYEGHIVVMVDTTPSVIIAPANMWHFTQSAQEYFQKPVVGTYLRWIRFLGILFAFILVPLWLGLFLSLDQLPDWMQWLGPKQEGTVPLWVQFFILEVGIDLILLALVHTPTTLSTSLGIVGAILLGELATKVGLFAPEAILYSAISALGTFAIPNVEFGWAVRLFRYLILALTALLKLPGLLLGVLITFLIFASTRSMGVPYLWPLIPFHWAALWKLLVRSPIPAVKLRSTQVGPVDADTGNDPLP